MCRYVFQESGSSHLWCLDLRPQTQWTHTRGIKRSGLSWSAQGTETLPVDPLLLFCGSEERLKVERRWEGPEWLTGKDSPLWLAAGSATVCKGKIQWVNPLTVSTLSLWLVEVHEYRPLSEKTADGRSENSFKKWKCLRGLLQMYWMNLFYFFTQNIYLTK